MINRRQLQWRTVDCLAQACCHLRICHIIVRQTKRFKIKLSSSGGTYRIAGNFRGRKLMNFTIFSHPRKFSPQNSRHATPIIRSVFAFRESFLRKMLLSYRSAKVFSLENFPLYGMVWYGMVCDRISENPPYSSIHEILVSCIFG